MAHHQHHQHHHARRPHPPGCCRSEQITGYRSSGFCCCCSCCRLTESTEGDPLVEAVAAQLIQASRPHLYPTFPKSHISHHRYHPEKPSFHQEQNHEQTHTLLSSLLRRIDALESSLPRFSAPPSYSLRDAAARTIQTHFRDLLVRRSRTLAHLKELALIKSAFNSIRSSLSQQNHFDCEALCDKAMDLLLKLDSIQDNDSMIRDGKRSVTRELVQFLDFIDGVSARRPQLRNKPSSYTRTGYNARKSRVLTGRVYSNCRDSGADRRELVEKLRDRVEKIRGFSRVLEKGEEDVELEGFQHLSDDDEENPSITIIEKGRVTDARKGILVRRQELEPRVKKSVSFAENGNLFSVSGGIHEPVSDEDDPNPTELVENHRREKDVADLSRETQDDDDDGEDTESGGSSQTSDGDEVEHYRYQDGNSVFSAPLPMKMESRANLTKKIKGINIIT